MTNTADTYTDPTFTEQLDMIRAAFLALGDLDEGSAAQAEAVLALTDDLATLRSLARIAARAR